MRSFADWIRTARGWMSLVAASTLVLVAAMACLSSTDSDKPDVTADLTAVVTAIATAKITPVVTADPTATADITPGVTPDITADEILVELLGGDTTIFRAFRDAFDYPVSNIEESDLETFELGDSLFKEIWVRQDGLGPTFNADSCAFCHINNGRGRPPLNEGDLAQGLLLRLSVETPEGLVGDPIYGGQLQDGALFDIEPEGRIRIAQEEITGQFADGVQYTLLKPTYSVGDAAYGAVHPDVLISPRIAPSLVGMGLLEAIPDEALLALTDPDDSDNDGISGRVNMVPNRRTGQTNIGRFGWKAGQPSVEQQAADAFNGDLGMTTVIYPVQDCPTNFECPDIPRLDDPEIDDERLKQLAFYNRTLAVPAMRDVDDPQVRRGAELFLSSGCSACHTPSHVTGEHEIAALSNQTIFPFTDLLLHDMGEGLADNRADRDANGQEWRTPPLWGIGLIGTVSAHTLFLHDGRARNLTEAVLWHGGEAESSRDLFRNLSAEERDALIAFLQAL